jgi:hypothetical protein
MQTWSARLLRKRDRFVQLVRKKNDDAASGSAKRQRDTPVGASSGWCDGNLSESSPALSLSVKSIVAAKPVIKEASGEASDDTVPRRPELAAEKCKGLSGPWSGWPEGRSASSSDARSQLP